MLSLGAIVKNTGQYVRPTFANKKDIHICPDCQQNVIPKTGKIKRHHFAHKTTNEIKCNYYDKPNESQIHKDAKMYMKILLDNK